MVRPICPVGDNNLSTFEGNFLTAVDVRQPPVALGRVSHRADKKKCSRYPCPSRECKCRFSFST
jgi:hypothetical protein